jgi:NADH-quinone oxidoreductase subunit A
MKSVLLIPPVAFFIYFLITFLISKLTMLTAAKGVNLPGKEKAYACGENVSGSKAQPDYSEFFPFAFFFTIMHVTVLVISTVPPDVIILPAVYLVTAAVSILILFRR